MIRSSQFDDIYFSGEDGLAETRHVFLDHNNLPAAFAGRDRFTIVETGFGTGLNFLSVWKLFEEQAEPDAVLDYVSFELYPLAPQDILAALSQWRDAFDGRLEKMAADYPLRIPGWHRIDFGRVRLTLIFDDVNYALPRLSVPRGVDAWFLDGFAPAKNPQMWSAVLFENMARLSHAGTTLASFTAAGIVKNGLRAVGFTIDKVRGYGRKRDMIMGRFSAGARAVSSARAQKIAIIGGGLAGTACASVLRQRNIAHTIFEASGTLAAGASGNPLGIFNPRFSAQRNAQSDFYAGAYAHAARILRGQACGSLHLITDDDKRKRFESCLQNWRWDPAHMQILLAPAASQIAGITIPHDALYLPDSGQVSPHDLCHQWAAGSEIRLNTKITSTQLGGYDAVIIACASGAAEFLPWVPLQSVRGQIVSAEISPATAALKTNLCYSGYIGANQNGAHVIGSTFQKWLDTTELRDEDNADILARLDDAVGVAPGKIIAARAAMRCAAQDRFPVIGRVPDAQGVFVSIAHGSHGIISSLAGAHLIADMIEGSVQSMPQDSVNSLSPQRFLDRAARKNEVGQSLE